MAKRLILDPKLDSAAADTLRESLLASKDDDIELDGTNVEQVGALCVELILSARHLWAAAGKAVTLDGASSQMIEDLSRFGLTEDDFQGAAT